MNLQQEVKDVIQSFVGQVNVVTVPRILLKYMNDNLNGGILLSQILYWSSRTSDEDGWFYKTYAEWKEELGLTEHQVRKVIKFLKEKEVDKEILIEKGIEKTKILETKVKKANGSPTVHYRISFDVFSESFLAFLRNEKENSEGRYLKKRVSKSKITRNDTQNNEVPITEITTETTSKITKAETTTNSSSLAQGAFFSESDEDDKELTYGKIATNKLYASLMEKRKIMNKHTNLNSWSFTIDKFIEDTIFTIQEFDEVLDWYIIHVGEQYIPQAYSAKTFCERFVNINDAMNRSNKESEHNGKTKRELRYEQMKRELIEEGVL